MILFETRIFFIRKFNEGFFGTRLYFMLDLFNYPIEFDESFNKICRE